MTTWGKRGKEIAAKLEGLFDEASIKALASAAINDINKIEAFDKRDNALKMVNREILKKFPRQESKTECYYHDPSGRAELPKWRHVIFKHLTLGKVEQPTEQPIEQLTEQAIATLDDMTIEQLELDADTQQILQSALEQSGMPLPDFIRQAIKVYAKTVTGKSHKRGEDLSGVPTNILLNDPTYSTHPGRAEELTKRAIKAIKYFNANIATEKADRWCITQSAIASLTGSRASAIGKAMEQYKTEIDDHNQTYELDGYSNRKPGKKIEEIINLSELCPDGLD